MQLLLAKAIRFKEKITAQLKNIINDHQKWPEDTPKNQSAASIKGYFNVKETEKKGDENRQKYDFVSVEIKETQNDDYNLLIIGNIAINRLRIEHFLTLFKNTLHLILIPILMLADVYSLCTRKTDSKNHKKNRQQNSTPNRIRIIFSTTIMPLYYLGFMSCNILGIIFPKTAKNAYLYLERNLYHKECIVFNGDNCTRKLTVHKKNVYTALTQEEIEHVKQKLDYTQYSEVNAQKMAGILYQ
ncbi:MAG: hypothetical protein VX737_02720 [Pseudomonadota bacterium]|nr:hypothetical protein [Pseudomonadota bacterium]